MAQQQQQHGGNLRNRKHANNNSAAVVVESMDDDHHQNAPVGGEGTPPNDPSTRVVREAEDAPDDAEDDKEEVSDDDDDDQFYLTPMDQRPLLLRLDVGPFLLAYSGLIAWDNAACSEEEAFLLLGISVVSFAFVVVLVLHLALVLWTQWSVPIKADVGFRCCKSTASDQQQLLPMTLWTHCLVQGKHTETDGSTLTGIVPIIQESSEVVVATFQDRIFRCSNRIPDADVSLWDDKGDNDAVHRKPCARRFRPVQYPIHLPFRWYATWKGHDSIHSAVTSGRVYGRNTTTLQLPAFLELLSQQMIAPFFIFQVFCVVLWSLDEYWYYALFTLFALILFESTLAYNRLKSLERLHTISHRNQHQRVWVRRGIDAATKMTWMSIPVAELVPGDWLSLSGSHVHVPADILLLQGSAVCDEALLTGESVPQLKQALDVTASTERTLLNMQDGDQKESLLFAGTNLLVGTPPSEATVEEITPDNGVSGIVLRTGFETVQGNLLRTMAHSTASTDGVHTVDTFVFILLLVLCAIGAAGYVLYEGWNDDRRNRFRLILHVVIIITSVVPPELPMELSLAVTNSVADLMRRSQVFCTEHFRIPWAGEIDVCCFDKTGTLTSDEMWLKGVRLFDGTLFEQAKEEESLSSSLDNILPWEVVRIMAACHSLASVSNARHRETVVGDPLEKSVMKQSGFHLLRNNVVESVVENGASKDRRPVNILHRFAFSSKLKRMTVLVNETGGNEKLWALTKGAPETIKGLLSNESLPNDYDDVSFYHMSRGRRVLAMAFRDMGDFKKLQILKEGGREQVEHSLVFAGFLVLDCPLKPDSKKIISELQKSGHSVVMITGDAILTAAEVARQVGIIRGRSGNRIVYRIQKRASESGANALDPLSYFECVAMGSKDAISDAFDLSTDMVSKMQIDDKNGGAHICLSGDVLISIALIAAHVDKASPGSRLDTKVDEKNLLLSPPVQAVLVKLVPVVSVFARHAPHQKEAIIAAFNNGGLQTLMCGDGTNDVGALKRAHVGISIISAPEVESKQREAAAKISQVKIDDKKDEKLPTKDKKKKRAKTLEESMRQLRDAQEELDHVELGDASVAAPFTSRNVSIKCCKDVIQQGRCTLVTMLQIYKILGINCLVNALVLSKLFIHGGKQGDRQLTVLGIAVAALFYFVTRAEPLSVISHVRPPASVLCVQTFLSISGQCLIHMATILLATEAAIAFVDPYDPSLVPDGPFNPNVLNTCTFLLTCLSTINTFAVNYRGRPFMKDLHENKLFYRSLQLCYAVLAIATLEVFPPLNDLLQLTTNSLSTDNDTFINESSVAFQQPIVSVWIRAVDFPIFMSLIMILDTVLSFSLERAIVRVFENT